MCEVGYYHDQLTAKETEVLDEVFRAAFEAAAERGVSLSGDDNSWRAGEAFAKWIIQSRGK